MEQTAPVEVTLGFQPALVFILTYASNGYAMAVIMREMSVEIYHDGSTNRTFLASNSAAITESGFQIKSSDNRFNYQSGQKAYYVAFQ